MADMRLRVSPEELRRISGEIEQQVTAAQRYWNELQGIVKASRYYWEGEAGDCSRRILEDLRQETEDIFARLRERPAGLLQMAGIYSQAEAQSAMLAKVLPDVLS